MIIDSSWSGFPDRSLWVEPDFDVSGDLGIGVTGAGAIPRTYTWINRDGARQLRDHLSALLGDDKPVTALADGTILAGAIADAVTPPPESPLTPDEVHARVAAFRAVTERAELFGTPTVNLAAEFAALIGKGGE